MQVEPNGGGELPNLEYFKIIYIYRTSDSIVPFNTRSKSTSRYI